MDLFIVRLSYVEYKEQILADKPMLIFKYDDCKPIIDNIDFMPYIFVRVRNMPKLVAFGQISNMKIYQDKTFVEMSFQYLWDLKHVQDSIFSLETINNYRVLAPRMIEKVDKNTKLYKYLVTNVDKIMDLIIPIYNSKK